MNNDIWEQILSESPTLQKVLELLEHPRSSDQLRLQSLKGLKKYGVTIDGKTRETYQQWLQHTLEEQTDLNVYYQKILSLPEFQSADEQIQFWGRDLIRRNLVATQVWSIIMDRELERVPVYVIADSRTQAVEWVKETHPVGTRLSYLTSFSQLDDVPQCSEVVVLNQNLAQEWSIESLRPDIRWKVLSQE